MSWLMNPFRLGLWTPAELSGLMLYSDDTADYTDGTWQNLKPGATWNLTQASSGSRPAAVADALNGKRVLRFDGSDDFLTAGTNMGKPQNYYAFIIYKPTKSRANFQCYIGSRSSDSAGTHAWVTIEPVWAENSGRLNWVYGDGSGGFRIGNTVNEVAPINQWCLISNKHTHGVVDNTIHVAGVPQANTGLQGSATAITGAAHEFAVGRIGADADFYAGMDFAAIVVTDTAISDTDRHRVEGWAAHRYGLTADLPSDHPYKNQPPVKS
jgi:hypothetical protein